MAKKVVKQKVHPSDNFARIGLNLSSSAVLNLKISRSRVVCIGVWTPTKGFLHSRQKPHVSSSTAPDQNAILSRGYGITKRTEHHKCMRHSYMCVQIYMIYIYICCAHLRTYICLLNACVFCFRTKTNRHMYKYA